MKNTFRVSYEESSTRLDRFLKRRFPHIPFSIFQKAIREKDIKVNGGRSTANFNLSHDDEIYIYEGILKKFSDAESQEYTIKSEEFKNLKDFKNACANLNIIYQDDHFIGINKESDIATQRGTGIIFALCDVVSEVIGAKIHVVHRLDKDTSGAIIFAKNPFAAARISRAFQEHLVKKTYIAITHGILPMRNFILSAPLIHEHGKWGEKMIVDEEGVEMWELRDKRNENNAIHPIKFNNWNAECEIMLDQKENHDIDERIEDILSQKNPYSLTAVTQFSVLKEFPDNMGNMYSIVQLSPFTGRKHQLRAHCDYLRNPIIGDTKYTDCPDCLCLGTKRLMLHASKMHVDFSTSK